MSLKQSIVVRNEFTMRMPDGKGTRGSHPGGYITEYMARKGAVEDLTPVRLQADDNFIVRYMARQEATETMDTVPRIKKAMSKAQGYGGVAFGYGSVSLSHEELMAHSSEIQALFEQDKTVMKTVLSFSEDYLKEMGLVPEDLEADKPGCYRGNLDQLKLRRAVMSGMDKIGRHFDDLQYIGVIQVDTQHVHCHLCAVDRGPGRLTQSGRQRGRLNDSMKQELRRGIDTYLDQEQMTRQMVSNVDHDRRNTVCFIKKFTHEAMERQGSAQFLLACLPKDRSLWRASTNRAEMKKPNAIVREYVTQILAEPQSGYGQALRSIDAYARERQQREGLSMDQYRRLYKNGQAGLVEDCMNSVYAVLKEIPEAQKDVRTPMMDAMSRSYDDMASSLGSDPMVEFGFKLRSYASRLDFHKKEHRKYEAIAEQYSQTKDVSTSAQPLVQFVQFEAEYQAQLMCKYQHFLSFLPRSDEFEDDFSELLKHRKRVSNMAKMRADPDMKKMTPEHAEEHGQKVYDLHGGEFVVTAPAVLTRRQAAMARDYRAERRRFEQKLAEAGLSLEQSPEDGSLAISQKKPYEFDDVKALDIHHLGYDFVTDIAVSKVNIDTFVEATEKRYELYQKAKAYLDQSGQSVAAEELPGKDVQLMKDVADRLRVDGRLTSQVPAASAGGRNKTVRLDMAYQADIDLAIRASVETTLQLGG